MAHDIFVLETDMARTSSGLIVPGRTGRMVVVIGTAVTEKMDLKIAEVEGASIAPYEAAVLVTPDVFEAAARDFVRQYGRIALTGDDLAGN